MPNSIPNARENASRIIPPPLAPESGDEESPDVWGFRDTGFQMQSDGAVVLTGNRYELCGSRLPNLVPWMSGVIQLPIDPKDVHTPSFPPKIPEPLANPEFVTRLRTFLSDGQIRSDALTRLRHGHGHTQAEMYAIKYGEVERVPDLVVYPENEDQVAGLVTAATKHSACLIPFGGGTSVTEALACPASERRFIVSVDMRRMSRILWIDPVNRTARIQAGMAGRHIVKQLAEYGFTMGHEPDSLEFSTLGGWIATNASGMKKNRYGNIEDLVLDLHAVTPSGELERSTASPRESVGLDPRQWLFGSEGSMGIITSAVVKLFPLPEVQEYGSVLFPDFESGVAFLKDLSRQGVSPASMRLVDNMQFQFSMALKPASSGFKAWKSKAEKFFVTRVKGFKPDQMTALTLVFEGSKKETAFQSRAVSETAKRYGGFPAGGENGRKGYQLTFGIAYIRDFVMNHYLLAESFETSVGWSDVTRLCERTKERIATEHAARGLPGKPFVSCRVTQVYETGVCVYFYFAYYYKGVADPTHVYSEIEDAARREILACGGSLSHHHGIGKLREKFLTEIKSPGTIEWTKRVKAAIDPDGVFACGNQLLEASAPRAFVSADATALRRAGERS